MGSGNSNVTSARGDSPPVARGDSPYVRGCVCARVSVGECPTQPTLQAFHIPSAIVLCMRYTMVLYM